MNKIWSNFEKSFYNS